MTRALAIVAATAGAVLVLATGAAAMPTAACPHQSEIGAPPSLQRAAMLCLTNRARAAHGLPALVESKPLERAAVHKTADMLTCDEFSHEACGREFSYWMSRFGYLEGCWSAAENIAWGTGSLGSVRGIFGAWMRSPGHRANILGPYSEIGISAASGDLEGKAGAVVWTQDFGSHEC